VYARHVGSVTKRTVCCACSGGTRLQRSTYACASSSDAPSSWIISAASRPTVRSCSLTREMRSDIAGRSVYLALAADEHDVVRMKPQNLLLNLPVAASQS